MQAVLYNTYASKMYSICLRYCNDDEEAQDLLQEGFIKVFKGLENYRFAGSFEGWMRKIFVNTSIAWYRRSVYVIPISEKTDNAPDNDNMNVLDGFNEMEIIKMLQKISPGYRQVFNMYVIEGYTHKEISEILEIGEGTSKSQLNRAKKALREMIESNTIKA
jgi:RNA polymerase sigma-70 factor (ECF subfamily)